MKSKINWHDIKRGTPMSVYVGFRDWDHGMYVGCENGSLLFLPNKENRIYGYGNRYAKLTKEKNGRYKIKVLTKI